MSVIAKAFGAKVVTVDVGEECLDRRQIGMVLVISHELDLTVSLCQADVHLPTSSRYFCGVRSALYPELRRPRGAFDRSRKS